MRHSILARALFTSALVLPNSLVAQSLLDRPPTMSGDWTGSSGTLYFNFVHRFSVSPAPERKVTNVPTLLLAAGLPGNFLAGVNYSTNSQLAAGYPNEWEIFGRWAPVQQDVGAPLDIGAQVGYNNAANGVDGEISLARRAGFIRAIVAGRTLSNPVTDGPRRYAIAGGGLIRLGPYLALAGDVASLTNRDTSERVAWSAGVHFAIPLTPHTISIQVTNTLVGTLQGASRGTNKMRYGFEFTIPLTLRRYFGDHSQPQSDSATAAASDSPDTATTVAPPATIATPASPPQSPPDTTTAASPAKPPPAIVPAPRASSIPSAPTETRTSSPVVHTGMKNLNYLPSRLQITTGTTVEWSNNDPLEHTVTAANKSFNSGLIKPGKKFRYTFTKAGTYNVYCTLHPFMKGTIVVKD